LPCKTIRGTDRLIKAISRDKKSLGRPIGGNLDGHNAKT
jgi:hypothetical protein